MSRCALVLVLKRFQEEASCCLAQFLGLSLSCTRIGDDVMGPFGSMEIRSAGICFPDRSPAR